MEDRQGAREMECGVFRVQLLTTIGNDSAAASSRKSIAAE